ncbi:unnamed protein product [Paramecium primaurelia]|uniref:Protein kinase domain-containing protein n=1 Tax=Paramecium primaurelia TaxID=5886 RepID=A0A8S1LQI8_PARPR|nr:unnamed protein product [Paramecium primaurelia]
MNQENSNSYVVEKQSLVLAQINQIKLLKNSLPSIKKKNLGYFSNYMKIEEKDDSFIFIFEDITELQFCNNFQDLFGVINERFNEIIPYIIMRILKLEITLNKFGIHLPMLNNTHFIDTPEPSQWIVNDQQNQMNNIQTKRIYLSKFGTDELKQDNQELINNKNIPNEIIDEIIKGNAKQIKFNEKMTVFALGCIIYEIYTRNSIFQIQNQSQLQERYNIIEENDTLDIEIKQLVGNCIKETPHERPTLIQLRQEYFTLLLKEKILGLEGFLIYKIGKYLIAPNELITGRLYIMEFFAKIKFIKLFFQKNSSKDAAIKSDTIILLQIYQELDKLNLDVNQELILWDDENTKDEINQFKKYYLKTYLSILENYKDKIIKQQKDQTIPQLPNKNYDVLYNNKIREILDQLKKQNVKSSQLNCLQHLNKIFKFRHLLEYFKPIQEKLIEKKKPYRRYDKILEIVFNNENDQILDLDRISKIKQNI